MIAKKLNPMEEKTMSQSASAGSVMEDAMNYDHTRDSQGSREDAKKTREKVEGASNRHHSPPSRKRSTTANILAALLEDMEDEILVDSVPTSQTALTVATNGIKTHSIGNLTDRSFHTMYMLHSSSNPSDINKNEKDEYQGLLLQASSDISKSKEEAVGDVSNRKPPSSAAAAAAGTQQQPFNNMDKAIRENCISISEDDKDESSIFRNERADKEQENSHNRDMSPGMTHTRVIRFLHKGVIKALKAITGVAILYPRITLIGLSLLSLLLLAVGCFTNFYIETQGHRLWPPKNSLTLDHAKWIWEGSYFNYEAIQMDIIIRKNGDNVLSQEGVARVFEAQDTFVNFGQYKEGCAFAEQYGDTFRVGQCWINSVTDFWNESYHLFNTTVRTDQDAIEILSQTVYPNGILVDVDSIMGKSERNEEDGLLTNARSYSLSFGIPWSEAAEDFEANILNRMLALREEWIDRDDEFRMEIHSDSSFSNEFLRAISSDLWLFPITFGVVILFTIVFAFGKCDKVKSRGLLGIGAAITIVASMMASFGILFCIGIPFTTQTVMVPFLMFGIGLDDSFILYGSYHRRGRMADVKERIHSTVEDVGVSIFLTTLTSMFAFVLGSFSHIPAIRWLCIYAVVSIGIDFVYQITFFVALVVLDERRIQQGRMDYCTCIAVDLRKKADRDDDTNETWDDEIVESTNLDQDDELHIADKLMSWWASQLLKSWVQAVAFLVFVAIMGASVVCATRLGQEHDFVAMVPQDSYLRNFSSASESYSTKDGIYGYAYFRDVDESNPSVQEQMLGYVEKLVASGKVDDPVYMWVRDFQQFCAEQPTNSTFNDMTFDEQMDQFLAVDLYHDLYHDEISQNTNGSVVDTRVPLHFRFKIRDTKEASDVTFTMRDISAAEPINQGSQEWKFFTYAEEDFLNEFYDQVIKELIFTSVVSVVAVSAIAMLFIPHWTAVLFVFPFITCLYINMLGFLYLSGVQINAISYVTLVMSIGLMIDYIMHILMRYYDCEGSRQQRVQETMSSVGASIFLGATSTFFGIICLSLSTSDVLRDIFLAVIGLITFGVLHGLFFLPIALANFGPGPEEGVTVWGRNQVVEAGLGPIETDFVKGSLEDGAQKKQDMELVHDNETHEENLASSSNNTWFSEFLDKGQKMMRLDEELHITVSEDELSV